MLEPARYPGINWQTTVGHELALPVLFILAIQHCTETPRGMQQVPDYVKEYLRNVPAVRKETRFVGGFPGEMAIIARRQVNDGCSRSQRREHR